MSQFDKNNYGRVQQGRVSPTDRRRCSMEPNADHNVAALKNRAT
jgi:hypothetical protein